MGEVTWIGTEAGEEGEWSLLLRADTRGRAKQTLCRETDCEWVNARVKRVPALDAHEGPFGQREYYAAGCRVECDFCETWMDGDLDDRDDPERRTPRFVGSRTFCSQECEEKMDRRRPKT